MAGSVAALVDFVLLDRAVGTGLLGRAVGVQGCKESSVTMCKLLGHKEGHMNELQGKGST